MTLAGKVTTYPRKGNDSPHLGSDATETATTATTPTATPEHHHHTRSDTAAKGTQQTAPPPPPPQNHHTRREAKRGARNGHITIKSHEDGMSGASDKSVSVSMVAETTLPRTSSEVREQERELRSRPEVYVRATQESPVRMEDEVHDIRDDVRRLATRFDGLEERMDESDRRIDERFDTIKEWTEGMKEWTVGVAAKLDAMDQNWKGMEALQRTILGKLSDIDSRVVQAERKGKE
ncbi:unnamed protein product [Tuber aestivum]|uniref:Uncharacterized protein n=1 Tax=Tuber aestivum TaxID=59557 RepID=A0A292PN02_9PEZI|nr:unnamed protein product [Tuber aestivum]